MSQEDIVMEMSRLMMNMACRPKRVLPQVQPKGESTCLLLLSLHQGEALPGTLAEESGVTTARIAATLKQLENKGLISRESNSRDRRQILVKLTEQGAQVAEKERRQMIQCWGNILEYLGPEDAEHGLRIMKKVSMYLEECCSSRAKNEE